MNELHQSDELEYCNFCGKSNDEVEKLIISDEVGICNECIELCNSILHEGEETEYDPEEQANLDPQAIVEFLDKHVIGQQESKVTLAVAIVNHYKRSLFNKEHFDKSNIIMFGPSGSGKTHIAKHIAKYLEVPFVIADATTLTESGYVGDDVTSLIARLYAESDFDIARCENGIIFLDEVDKISRKSESPVVRDVSGEGVQQALLKLVEGAKCNITHKGETIQINTHNILFIAAGAFVGIEDVISKRNSGNTGIGFTANSKVEADHDCYETSDFISYGLIPEFIGRFPVITRTRELTRDELIKILTEPKDNLIKQMKFYFEVDGLKLSFNRDAIEAIVDQSLTYKTGARGLRSILERSLRTTMYTIKDIKSAGHKKITVTKDVILGKGQVIFE